MLKKRIAIKGALTAAALCIAASGWAQTSAGTIVQVDGPLIVKKANSSIRAVAAGSALEAGDTLMTQSNTYARVKLSGGDELTLTPSTTFKMGDTVQGTANRNMGTAPSTLVRGSVRYSSGEGSDPAASSYVLNTPGGTIKGNGSFIAQWVDQPTRTAGMNRMSLVAGLGLSAPDFEAMELNSAPLIIAQNIPPATSAKSPGLYVQVIDGMINLSNPGGTQQFAAGQFGFVPGNTTPPVILPQNPGLQFSPPPAFNSNSGAPPSTGTVDCIVR